MRNIGVILLSGGLDSTTVASYAKKKGYELTAITLEYGQKHVKEIQAAEEVANILGIKHETFDVSFFSKVAWYSALTTPDSYEIPKMRNQDDMAKDIPLTYVPLRNTFFITVAAAFLESMVLNLVEMQNVAPNDIEASLFIAANAIDYSGYPDCRPEFYRDMIKTLNLGSKWGTQYQRTFKIETPLITKTKAQIVKMANDLGAPLEHTWSCYEGGEVPCGTCDSCILRAKGFTESGFKDPLLTRLGNNANNLKGK